MVAGSNPVSPTQVRAYFGRQRPNANRGLPQLLPQLGKLAVMGTRTANGTGNLRKRPNGSWEARLSYTDVDGTLKRVSVYGKTQREVREKAKAVRDRVDNGAPATDDKVALAAWMARWRETTLAVSDRKESTRSLYASLSRKHIEAGVIGPIPLAKLRPSDVEKLILALRSATKPGKPTKDTPNPEPVRDLSDSTIRSIYTVLRLGLDGAVRDGLLARNPATSVQRPGVARKEAEHLDPEQVTQLLAAGESSRYHTALVLIATTGLRRRGGAGAAMVRCGPRCRCGSCARHCAAHRREAVNRSSQDGSLPTHAPALSGDGRAAAPTPRHPTGGTHTGSQPVG